MMLLLGLASILGAGMVFYRSEIPMEWVLGALLAGFALLVLDVARVLQTPKGGIAYRPFDNAVLLFAFGERNPVVIPRTDWVGVEVSRRQEMWGKDKEPTVVGTLSVVLKSGVRVVLLEHPFLVDMEERAEWIAKATGMELLKERAYFPETSRGSSSRAQIEQWRSGTRYPLSTTWFVLGTFLMAIGLLLFASVEQTGVVGFLFGPLFGAIGLVFLLIWTVRALGHEQVTLQETQVSQRFVLGPMKWSFKAVELGESPHAMVRFRMGGARGFWLEIGTGETTLVMGSGAVPGGSLLPEQLMAFGGRVCGSLSCGRPLPP